MVPADFANFFTVMAGVGATLFGLIFLVITIKPEVTSAENTAVMRQVQVASSYIALLNPLVISLLALRPHATIGTITLIMSTIGFVTAIVTGVSLLEESLSWAKRLNRVFFICGGFVIYGFEIFYAIRLEVIPGDVVTLYNLTILLVIIYLYGIGRAWDLVGERQFHLRDLLNPFLPKRMVEINSDTLHAESTGDANKQRD